MTTLVLAFAFARSFFDAFVLLRLWQWFIVPLGAVHIGYWHAYGIDNCIMLLVLPLTQKTDDEPFDAEKAAKAVTGRFFGYALVLGVGYCAHLLMGHSS